MGLKIVFLWSAGSTPATGILERRYKAVFLNWKAVFSCLHGFLVVRFYLGYVKSECFNFRPKKMPTERAVV